MGRLNNRDLWDEDEDGDEKVKKTRRNQNEEHDEEEESEDEELTSVEETAIQSQKQSLWQWLIWCGAISAVLLILSATLNYMFITACVFGLTLIFIPFGLAKATLRVEHGEPTEDFGEGSPFVAALLFPVTAGGRYPQLASISGIGLFTIILGVILSAATKHTGFESTAVAGGKNNQQVAQNNPASKTPPVVTPPVNPLPPLPKEEDPKIPDPVDNGKKDFPKPKEKEKDPDPAEPKPFPPKAPPLPKDWKGSSETGMRAFFDFDEEQGDACKDIGPEKLEATLHGCKRVPGKRGGAIELNGTTDFIGISNDKSLDFAENAPFTVTMWVKTEKKEGVIFSCRNKPDHHGIFNFFVEDGKATMWLRKDNNIFAPSSVQSRKIINDGKWHHLAFSRTDKGEILVYIDGVLDAKGNFHPFDGPGQYTSNLRAIGVEPQTLVGLRGVNSNRFKGCIDELGIYGEALGETRLKKMINAK